MVAGLQTRLQGCFQSPLSTAFVYKLHLNAVPLVIAGSRDYGLCLTHALFGAGVSPSASPIVTAMIFPCGSTHNPLTDANLS